jgi:PAS domain S-box-containing protein
VLKDADGKTCELGLLNSGEEPTSVQVFGVPVQRQGRADSALRLAVMDITERKQAEETLRRAHEELECRVGERTAELVQANERLRSSEREFRLLADSIPAYFSYIDQDLRYRFINKRYGNLFGRPTAELIGQLVKDVVGEANFCTIEPRLREALVGRETSFIYPKVLPNADARWMSVHYTPDRGEPGPITGVLALMIDVTDQKRSELAL